MGSDLANKTKKDFESIKHTDENGVEFWYARELIGMLDYSKCGNFKSVITKAKEDCKGSDITEEEHFADVGRVLKVGNNAEMKVELKDYEIIPMNQIVINIDVVEDKDIFDGNAIKKAKTISKKLDGKMCLADDSGI